MRLGKIIAKWTSSRRFPDKKRFDEDAVDNSFEASHRIGLDMGHLKDSVKAKKKQSPKTEVEISLKEEILQLEKRLQDQFEVRHAMEKALGYRTSSHVNAPRMSIPKPATELIKEIALLELEVVHLEQHLLSLYRKAFGQQISSVSPSSKYERSKSPVTTPRGRSLDVSRPDTMPKRETSAVQSGCGSHDNPWKESSGIGGEEKLLDSGVHRCHSSLSQRSAFPTRTSPPEESLGRAVRACHSQPLSMMEYAHNATNIFSLAEHLGTHISDHVPETPNKLSEDMIKCMSAIYCKLSDPPLMHNGLSSPNSSLSSVSAFSPRDQCDIWSPGFRNNSSFDVRLDNPFLVDGLKEFSGPYSTMVEVPWIYRDSQKLGDVEHLLQNYRSLICRLEDVDPRKLKHEEKLAFWINIHNALVMHAYLAYGIPQNNVKRLFLLLKAAYNVGGFTISADTVQNSILGCRMSRPGQWLRLLLSSRSKFKTGDERQAYAIENPEPLLHFALCSGSHSDPAVRVYTSKRVFLELEAAKDEYIRATFGVRKDQKILLPRIVESFAKDSGLCQAGVIEMIQQTLPVSLRNCIKKSQLGKPRKSIEWIPHNFTFRYLISKELVR
ncbi:uncharacterized protein LOC110650564 isoform X2 [Hevea brasiliensis]|uniref:uncharacterized protein LOC110650564 isoform X2 n=1 Tax=Hevea brasiliensis TaxID=3981 RepID=UPI0025EEC1A4|nr:uncharacterized protein LOC110650564 isoform X2 [Hevea brasiliensis]